MDSAVPNGPLAQPSGSNLMTGDHTDSTLQRIAEENEQTPAVTYANLKL